MKMTLGAFVAAATIGLSACVPETSGNMSTVVAPGTANLNVVNRSGRTAFYVFISPCSSNSWGIDRLGSSILSNGDTSSITLSSGCYDLKASDDVTNRNLATWERRGVNLSSGGSFDWTLFQ